MDIFAENNRKKNRRKRLVFLAFYGPALFFFALLTSLGPMKQSLCFFKIYCAGHDTSLWLKALILYGYYLLIALLVVYVYKGVESLVKHKNHIFIFKTIFVFLPLIFTGIIWLIEPEFRTIHYFFIVFFAFFSIAGLLMIELRKK